MIKNKGIYSKSGFTMVELIICAVIVSILLGAAAYNFFPMIERSRAGEAKAMLVAIYRGAQLRLEKGLPLEDAAPCAAKWLTVYGLPDDPNNTTQGLFGYWAYDDSGIAPKVNAAYAYRRIGNPPFAGEKAAVDYDKFLRIDFLTGVIASSAEY